jgi:hypothetical protein
LYDWQLDSGHVVYDGNSTDYGKLEIRVYGQYGRSTENPEQSEFLFQANQMTDEGDEPDWWMRLVGILDDEGTGVVRWKEFAMPLRYHAERERLDRSFVSGTFYKRVYRQRTLSMHKNRPREIEETVLPH